MNISPTLPRHRLDSDPSSGLRAIEQIVLQAVQNNQRIIGFTAPEAKSGVSSVARSTAEVFARAGFKTLFIDLTQPVQEPSGVSNWSPGEDDPKQCIYRSVSSSGSDRLIAKPSISAQAGFNNIIEVRRALVDQLAEYSRIVIDLPSLLDVDIRQINPGAAAAACDSVLLICVRGRVTQERLTRAIELAHSAGGKITGTIFNETEYESSGLALSRLVSRWFRAFPSMANKLAGKIRNSTVLNG